MSAFWIIARRVQWKWNSLFTDDGKCYFQLMSFSKALHLPPPGRPRWTASNMSHLDLLYLGWGQRFFGQHPIPISRHEGWIYAIVQKGNPILCGEQNDLTLKTGEIVIIDPECATGWSDQKRGCASLLVWMWKSSPRITHTIPPQKGLLRWKLNQEFLRSLTSIHSASRNEVENLDVWTNQSLEHLRLQLDVFLARSIKIKQPPPSTMRFDLAIRWMQQHLSARNPVASICDYLQVSSSTLNRLFLLYSKETPAGYHQRLRMQSALELIRANLSIKEIAYRLGFQHPNDFSRAFRAYTGKSPLSMRMRIRKSIDA
jgi:AraC-like DNA-binding protein